MIFKLLFSALFYASFIVSVKVQAQTKNKKQEAENSTVVPFEENTYNGLQWRNIGPYRAGRCVAVAGVNFDTQVYYAGQVGGGVWKTIDGGQNWFCVSDTTFTSSSVGAIGVAQSNPNTVYVGMGEVEMRGNISFGDGVYKTTDAGKTWKHIGLKESYAIGTIAVHPQNENIVYVAAQGHIWGPNKERGLYKSIDGGVNWNLILKGFDDTTGCVDVKIDPTNSQIIYASMYKAFRTPYSLSSGGKGSGLYKSIDAGETWQLISENAGMPKGLMGKMIVTISTQDHLKLWASVENKEEAGIYFSKDGGDTWLLLTKENDLIQRPWYFSQLFVDPQNDREIYILSVEYWKSFDQGKEFARTETATWDLHDMWINAQNSDNYILGGDGGPTITFDDGKNWTATDLPTAQFYHVNIDQAFPYHLYGGQQDNSSIKIKSRSSESTIDESDWKSVAGGEAGFIVPDPLNYKITYGGEYDGIFSSYNEESEVYRIISINPEQHYGAGANTALMRFNWTFPIYFSPHQNNCLYATSNYVHRSFDGGVNWETISPDLTKNDIKTLQTSGGPVTLDNTGVEYYATIFSIAESPIEPGVLWTGSDDGLVFLSMDNGKEWLNVTPNNLEEWSMISNVEPSYFEAGTCYLSATRYKFDDQKPYLFKTTNYGKTWQKIINGLPENTYNRCIRNDPNKKGMLYAGLETGVYFSTDDGSNWQSLQLNLPNTPVVDLQIHKGERDIAIATHGRSFWILDDITPLYELTPSLATEKAHLFTIHSAIRTVGPSWSADEPDGESGQNEPLGVKVRYYLKDNHSKELQLKFYETNGTFIIGYSNKYDSKRKPITSNNHFYTNEKSKHVGILKSTKGMHEFIWNMRYPDAKGDTSATFDASLMGPLAVPGQYIAKMFSGDSLIAEKQFLITLDTRNKATQNELQAQFDLNMKICMQLNAISRATESIRIIKKQIANYLEKETDSAKVQSYKIQSEPIIVKLTQIEEQLYNPKILAYEDNLKFPIMLEEKLAGLNYFLQMADAGPTTSMHKKYEDLAARIAVQLNLLQQLKNLDIKTLNTIAGKQIIDSIHLEE